MKTSQYETMCAKAGLKPELRASMKGLDFFVADGFSPLPERDFQKFGAEPKEFPYGAYGTLWLIAEGEDKIQSGGMCLFDAFHNPGVPLDQKKELRLNMAKEKAEEYLSSRIRVSRGA